ncbi:glycosyltransferase involved in cell wall biosynthesis [Pullulanibacillus pueri]|nr:glycosyltransferase family 2 protein [Pullulanibacillus pueri]MBM7681299.1 glycosyltransferase involved in cell wall biosynthesis [Pullulanibacillus pueri]
MKRKTVPIHWEPYKEKGKLSIIIPARNEEENIAHLLDSLHAQTYHPYEIIVVNDGSSDQTKAVAESYGVKVIDCPKLPQGWTGKTWAVWNGFLRSTGELIAFLDADIRLAPQALEILLKARQKSGGVLSIVPYHFTKKLYERLALVFNILGVFAFTSPFEIKNPRKGLYGSCILTTREDYEKVKGHDSIKSEILDDLNLGARFIEEGIAVHNYIGGDLVAFRMYPQGIKSEFQGFGKGAVLSTTSLRAPTLLFVVLWILGLVVSESFLFFLETSFFLPLFIGYLLYMLQIVYFVKFVGRFGFIMPIFHILSTLFFLIVILYSVYQVVFLKEVTWKGRTVEVGRKRQL